MNICEYGCGEEAKFYLKTVKKWCCSKSCNSCKFQRSKINHTLKEIWKSNDYKLKQKTSLLKYFKTESIESKENRKRKVKDSIIKNNSKKVMREKAIERNKNPEYIRNLSIKASKRMEDPNRRKQLSRKCRITIEKIKQKYPFLLEIEELRYNPENLEDREIQARCKNPNCRNSKELNGWFTPNGVQTSNRIYSLKNLGSKAYFFCSDNCKLECDLFNMKIDPETYKEFKRYSNRVWRETYRSIKNNYDKIVNIELRGMEFGFDLDHKYSIYEGFKNNIDSKIIGHYKNLEILKSYTNRNIKNRRSSILIEDLLKEIESIGS